MSDLKLVWVDLEMTGLEVETCAIVEIAAIVTGDDLRPLAEYEAAVHQPEGVLAGMNDFVRDMHTKSGLIERVRASTVSVGQAERAVCDLVAQFSKPREAVMAGNSIHQDRRFIAKYMPTLDGYLHYRQVDVSSIKVLSGAWHPEIPKFEKKKSHTALSDIRESLAELAYYRVNLFK
jgi:oligoribonuclease